MIAPLGCGLNRFEINKAAHSIFLRFGPAREAFDCGLPARHEGRFLADNFVDEAFHAGLNSCRGFDGAFPRRPGIRRCLMRRPKFGSIVGQPAQFPPSIAA